MQRKLLAIIIFIMILMSTILITTFFNKTQAAELEVGSKCRETVDKQPGEEFTVVITFKNKGGSKGEWKISSTFEGEDWIWKGDEKELALNPSETETLTWNGVIPEDAAINSVARLILYYNNDVMPLDWWIRVIPKAELGVIYSNVS